MLKSKTSRIGALVATSGLCLILGSIIFWSFENQYNRVFFIDRDYAWRPVKDVSETFSLDGWDIEYRLNVNCAGKFSSAQLTEATQLLSRVLERIPTEVRDWRTKNASASLDIVPLTTWSALRNFGLYSRTGDAFTLSKLRTEYNDWFRERDAAQKAVEEWTERASETKDKVVRYSELQFYQRNRPTEDREDTIKRVLGVSVYPNGPRELLDKECVSGTHLIKYVTRADLRSNLDRWVSSHLAILMIGLSLIAAGLSFSSLVRWVRSGD